MVTPLSSSSYEPPPPLVRLNKGSKSAKEPASVRHVGPTVVDKVARAPCSRGEASKSVHGPLSPSQLVVQAVADHVVAPDQLMTDSFVTEGHVVAATSQQVASLAVTPGLVPPGLSLVPPALWYAAGQHVSGQGVPVATVPAPVAPDLVRVPEGDLVF